MGVLINYCFFAFLSRAFIVPTETSLDIVTLVIPHLTNKMQRKALHSYSVTHTGVQVMFLYTSALIFSCICE